MILFDVTGISYSDRRTYVEDGNASYNDVDVCKCKNHSYTRTHGGQS